MEVLFEYRGSRRQITIASGDSVTKCIGDELHLVGRAGARVVTADTDLNNTEAEGGRVYLLQKWSPQWDCYVDVSNANEIKDGDRLAVVAKPKPPSKVCLMFAKQAVDNKFSCIHPCLLFTHIHNYDMRQILLLFCGCCSSSQSETSTAVKVRIVKTVI